MLIDEFSHVFNNVKGRGKWLKNATDIEEHLHLGAIALKDGTKKLKPHKNFLFHQLEVENLINSGFKANFMNGSETLLVDWLKLGR